ncbi:MAG: SDR family NAD(P)-dependent oxidoreductase [Actinobacteria bacterium]|nr:SDR family NAD(P)-dependent oxidoreductase [Actinomycetota bacterium]
MAANDPVLVTGCSSGIGLATAQRLLTAGHTVYATARRPETLDGLARAGARVLALDVTDEASMRTAVEAVEHEHGAVGALVNNAGYGVYGPVEEVDLDDVRAQFETNVFGLGRMCQLVLPGMRRAGRGRIVNISSMGGRLVFPTGGWYHASKYAVEALSDALRLEVKPFGVDVVVVEPGLIRTEFGTTASHGLAAGDEGSAYGGLRSYADELMANAYRSRAAAEPGVVADAVVKAVQTRRPRTRYVVTAAAKLQVQTRRLAGDRVWDMAMRQAYRLR